LEETAGCLISEGVELDELGGFLFKRSIYMFIIFFEKKETAVFSEETAGWSDETGGKKYFRLG